MAWKTYKQSIALWVLLVTLISGLTSCSVSYKFNGGSIDYTRLKSIVIADVHNRAPIIYPPFAVNFTEQLKDFYTRRTRLDLVQNSGDLELECVITGYDLSPMAVKEDNFAERTIFAVTVNVKYVNHDNDKESFERSFRAQRDFDRTTAFNSVQDALLEEITEDLIKQIYNATIENW